MSEQSTITHPLPAPATHAHDRLRWVLVVLAVVLAVLVAVVTTILLTQTRQAELESARARTRDASQLLSEHVQRIFRTTDFLVEQAGQLALTTPLPRLSAHKPANLRIRELARNLPEPGNMFITDDQGILRLSSRDDVVSGFSLSDRIFFSSLRNSSKPQIIGPLVMARQGGDAVFHLARRIEDSKGTFIGVAAASMDSATFTHFYDTLQLGPQSAITFLDLQGRTILRQPHPESWVDSNRVGSDQVRLLTNGRDHGTLQIVSPFDGIERLISFQVVQPYGVIVVVGTSLQDALADWTRSVYYIGVLAVGISIVLIWLIALIFAALRREEILVHSLEDTVLERTQEAHRQAVEARRANASKTRFLAATSHDLRQPLQAAGMFVEVLSVRLDGTDHAPVVDKLRQSIDATQSLMNTLLDASSLEAGKVQCHPVDFPLDPLLHALIEQMEPQAQERGLTLRHVSTSLRVHSDPMLLERILRNLLVNALRYTERGGIVMGCRRRGDQVAICVADSGLGIPPDDLDRIFEDFTRLDHTAKSGARGLGLGLGIVKRTAQLLGHRVTVRSDLGRGSCFAVIVDQA